MPRSVQPRQPDKGPKNRTSRDALEQIAHSGEIPAFFNHCNLQYKSRNQMPKPAPGCDGARRGTRANEAITSLLATTQISYGYGPIKVMLFAMLKPAPRPVDPTLMDPFLGDDVRLKKPTGNWFEVDLTEVDLSPPQPTLPASGFLTPGSEGRRSASQGPVAQWLEQGTHNPLFGLEKIRGPLVYWIVIFAIRANSPPFGAKSGYKADTI